jgi:predicted metalloprotease
MKILIIAILLIAVVSFVHNKACMLSPPEGSGGTAKQNNCTVAQLAIIKNLWEQLKPLRRFDYEEPKFIQFNNQLQTWGESCKLLVYNLLDSKNV